MSRALVVCALCVLLCGPSLAMKIPGNKALIQGPLDCVKTKDSVLCDDQDDCNWCEGTKVGSGCYPLSASKLLPSKYFKCDKDVGVVKGLADATCDGRGEGDCVAPDCVWCTSAAVGGGCYTPSEAKLLPGAIFKCKTAPSA